MSTSPGNHHKYDFVVDCSAIVHFNLLHVRRPLLKKIIGTFRLGRSADSANVRELSLDSQKQLPIERLSILQLLVLDLKIGLQERHALSLDSFLLLRR